MTAREPAPPDQEPYIPPPNVQEKPASAAAQARLAKALRENLKRRKAQLKARDPANAPGSANEESIP